MPIVTIYGIPSDFPEEKLRDAVKEMKHSVRDIGGKVRKTTILIPKEKLGKSSCHGVDIVFFIDVLPGTDKTERSQNADAIGSVLSKYFPDRVECFFREISGYQNLFLANTTRKARSR